MYIVKIQEQRSKIKTFPNLNFRIIDRRTTGLRRVPLLHIRVVVDLDTGTVKAEVTTIGPRHIPPNFIKVHITTEVGVRVEAEARVEVEVATATKTTGREARPEITDTVGWKCNPFDNRNRKFLCSNFDKFWFFPAPTSFYYCCCSLLL